MDFIASAEQLGKLGTITILLTMVIALAYVYWDNTKKDRERTDALVDNLIGIKTQLDLNIEVAKKMQEYTETLVKDNIEHYREANMKCKDEILMSVRSIEGDVNQIKQSVHDLKLIKTVQAHG